MTRIDLFWTRQSRLIMISIFWARNNLVMKSSTCSKEYGLRDRFLFFCLFFLLAIFKINIKSNAQSLCRET